MNDGLNELLECYFRLVVDTGYKPKFRAFHGAWFEMHKLLRERMGEDFHLMGSKPEHFSLTFKEKVPGTNFMIGSTNNNALWVKRCR